MNTSLFINGEFKDTPDKQKVINPSDAEVIAEVASASREDAELALSSARLAFDKGAWREIPLSERKNFLLKISEGILEKAKELAELETLNTGKPIKEATFMDIPSSAKSFEYIAHNLEGYLKEEAPLVSGIKSELLREAVGVVVLIVPWNYPLLIASWKLASCLAAGNTVILKPSSLTPLSALELGRIIHDARLPKGVVNILNGSGEKLGSCLCSDKRVDMISFTGSNAVGSEILEYASRNVKKTIMELGGKSANIVLKDADVEVAVNSSLCSVFLNQGQMCTATSRILVEDDIYDKFVEEFSRKTRRIKLGPGMDYQTQMGPLISRDQRKRVMEYVEKAKQERARLVCGGKIPAQPELAKGFFFEPTVFIDVAPEMSIFQEEVFGPVSCISRFSGLQEAIELANDSGFGLAACIWTKDESRARDLAASLNAGTVWVNTYGMFYNELPYGGFKQSGFGKELGRAGFLEYTRLKSVIIDKSVEAPLVNYWYGL